MFSLMSLTLLSRKEALRGVFKASLSHLDDKWVVLAGCSQSHSLQHYSLDGPSSITKHSKSTDKTHCILCARFLEVAGLGSPEAEGGLNSHLLFFWVNAVMPSECFPCICGVMGSAG